jgi:hypothetical protein
MNIIRELTIFRKSLLPEKNRMLFFGNDFIVARSVSRVSFCDETVYCCNIKGNLLCC